MGKMIISCVLLLGTNMAFAGSAPWLPAPESLSLQLSRIHQNADTFYKGKEKADLPADLSLDTNWLDVNYGLTDDYSIDAKVGYAKSSFSPEGSESGITDSTIGFNWRFKDEFISEGPSLGVRLAATLAGDYSKDKINSIGDKASGAEVSFLTGKVFSPKLATSGELGYRYRSSNVPNEYFVNVGLATQIITNLGANVGFNIVESVGDVDISDSDFAGKFSLLAESFQSASIGLSYSFKNYGISGSYSKILDGRNVSITETFGVAISAMF